MRSLFICPVCAAALQREERRYICPAGHTFDRAKEGYCNLLPANRKHSKAPGDDKAMAAARSVFLGKGYYAPLREQAVRLGRFHDRRGPTVLDAGCGEGYYTDGIYRAPAGCRQGPQMAGTDISKFILRRAAKRKRTLNLPWPRRTACPWRRGVRT